MSLQTRTPAPGKARRAAKGKPRHTTAQKAARKTVAAKPAARGTAKRSAESKPIVAKSTIAKKATTERYSDREVVTKKDVRLADRSKLRAQRFQERTASKSKNIEGAPKGNPKQSREERTFSKPAKAFKGSAPKRAESTSRPAKPVSRAAKFVEDRAERASRPFRPDRPERPAQSDTRPTTRREAVKAKIARSDDGRPNFIPQKREKFNPSAPRGASTRSASARSAAPTRDTETSQRPARDRRNDSPAYARDDRPWGGSDPPGV